MGPPLSFLKDQFASVASLGQLGYLKCHRSTHDSLLYRSASCLWWSWTGLFSQSPRRNWYRICWTRTALRGRPTLPEKGLSRLLTRRAANRTRCTPGEGCSPTLRRVCSLCVGSMCPWRSFAAFSSRRERWSWLTLSSRLGSGSPLSAGILSPRIR